MTIRDEIAKAIWAKRPDCAGKPWPLADDYSKRAYKHNPIAAVDLCFAYADAAIEAQVSAPDSVRLELAALLNPWRPIEEMPEDADIYVTPDGRWWRYVLPAAGIMEEK